MPRLEKKLHHTHFLFAFCLDCFATIGPCLPQFAIWCFEELKLKTTTCCYEVGAKSVPDPLYSNCLS